MCIHVANVPADKAQAVMERVAACFAGSCAPPLVAIGLMQHECKMSIMNFGVKKAATYTEPIKNKEELLLVTGEAIPCICCHAYHKLYVLCLHISACLLFSLCACTTMCKVVGEGNTAPGVAICVVAVS